LRRDQHGRTVTFLELNPVRLYLLLFTGLKIPGLIPELAPNVFLFGPIGVKPFFNKLSFI
jgi:hypothetical protein